MDMELEMCGSVVKSAIALAEDPRVSHSASQLPVTSAERADVLC